MTFAPAVGTGSIKAARDEQRTSASSPTHLGSATIEGVKYWIAGWRKQNPDGTGWMSLSFKIAEQPTDYPPQRQQQPPQQTPQRQQQPQGRAYQAPDDEIPW